MKSKALEVYIVIGFHGTVQYGEHLNKTKVEGWFKRWCYCGAIYTITFVGDDGRSQEQNCTKHETTILHD